MEKSKRRGEQFKTTYLPQGIVALLYQEIYQGKVGGNLVSTNRQKQKQKKKS